MSNVEGSAGFACSLPFYLSLFFMLRTTRQAVRVLLLLYTMRGMRVKIGKVRKSGKMLMVKAVRKCADRMVQVVYVIFSHLNSGKIFINSRDTEPFCGLRAVQRVRRE